MTINQSGMTVNEKLFLQCEPEILSEDVQKNSVIPTLLKLIVTVLILLTTFVTINTLLDELVSRDGISVVALEKPKVIQVAHNETLWEIAKKHTPSNLHFTDYMKKIKRANQMKESGLIAGQKLILP